MRSGAVGRIVLKPSRLESLRTSLRLLRYGFALAAVRPHTRRTVADQIEAQAAARRDHPFIVHDAGSVSYAAFNEGANRVAHWAHASGLRAGDVVALLMQNRPEFLETWAGLCKIGVTTALINTNLTHRGLGHALASAGASHVIVGAECLPHWATLGADRPADVTLWGRAVENEETGPWPPDATDLGPLLSSQPGTNPDLALRADRTAGDDLFYIYTSGTTGLPKAARFSHLKFFTTGVPARVGGFGSDDVMYCALPLYHSAGGAMAVSTALAAGGTLALERKFSASRFWPNVHRYRATAFQYIGEFCRYLLNVPPAPTDRGHRVRLAVGNGLRPDIWEEFQRRFGIERILEFYGATEGNIALMNLDNKVGSVGKLPSRLLVDARLIRYDVDADVHPRDARGFAIECGPGEAGELVGRIVGDTKGRFEGYTSREATEKKVLRDLMEPRDAWFRTGDLLRRDEEGYFYFVDRIGDTFRWKGENVSTQDVAEAVGTFPGIQMTNVYGVAVPGQDGRAGMAAIVLHDPGAFEPAAFHAHVSDALPAYAVPQFVRLQPEPDVTGTFKIRKVDLQKEGFDPSIVRDPLFVRSDAGTYEPLTAAVHAEIASGKRRL